MKFQTLEKELPKISEKEKQNVEEQEKHQISQQQNWKPINMLSKF